MACYSPLKGFVDGVNENGKRRIVVRGFGVDHLGVRAGKYFDNYTEDRNAYDERVVREFLEIPCGQCIGCRLAYSRDWANRCLLELRQHSSSYFVTLTYDEAHVPISYYGDPSTGEAMASLTLVKRDVQLFMKRLRKRLGDKKIRYYLAGEYGENSFRPHYHAIIFGLELTDLVYYKKSAQGYNYFVSQFLNEIWGLGFVVVGEVTWETCAYTARYMMKKLKGLEAVLYEDLNIVPPFVLMSRHPGLARHYYDGNNVFDYDYINVSTPSGGKKFRPPRYFKKLFEVDCPDESAISKEHAVRMAKAASEIKLSNTSVNYLELLDIERRAIENKMKVFSREFDV